MWHQYPDGHVLGDDAEQSVYCPLSLVAGWPVEQGFCRTEKMSKLAFVRGNNNAYLDTVARSLPGKGNCSDYRQFRNK